MPQSLTVLGQPDEQFILMLQKLRAQTKVFVILGCAGTVAFMGAVMVTLCYPH